MFGRLLAGLCLLAAAAAVGAHPPRGIAVSPDGRVYFSDLERIWMIGPGGRLSIVREAGDRHTHEIAVDGDGNLYGEDATYEPGRETYLASVWKLGPDRRFSFVHGPTRTPARGIGVCRDRRGCTHLADRTAADELLLYRRCPGARAELLVGTPTAARSHRVVLLSNIGGAALGPDQSFYFRHGNLIRRARAGGRVVMVTDRVSNENFGIAVDREGVVHAAEYRNRRVVRIGLDGRRTIALTSRGPWAPTGIAVGSGRLHALEVTDPQAGAPTRFRVRRVTRDGRAETIAQLPTR